MEPRSIDTLIDRLGERIDVLIQERDDLKKEVDRLRSVCGLPSVRRKGLSDSREVFCPVREWFTTNWGRQERFLFEKSRRKL